MNEPLASVIIPTYNRKDSLLNTLESLKGQNIPPKCFEVVVVDDGSMDDTGEIVAHSFPFSLEYKYQSNSGDAAARNTGAGLASGEYLVFIDDDIILDRDCLRAFYTAVQGHDRTLVLGNLQTAMADPPRAFHLHLPRAFPIDPAALDSGWASFTDCLSGFMAIRRADYLAIGMMQGLSSGGSNVWCDMDFAYRGHCQGYRFYRCMEAIGYHYDAALLDFATYCRRSENAGRLGALLFRKHPDLRGKIPMFLDKEPLSVSADPPLLVVRKLARAVVSSAPAVTGMKHLIRTLEDRNPSSPLLAALYRWTVSAHIYRGYRQGRSELTGADR